MKNVKIGKIYKVTNCGREVLFVVKCSKPTKEIKEVLDKYFILYEVIPFDEIKIEYQGMVGM